MKTRLPLLATVATLLLEAAPAAAACSIPLLTTETWTAETVDALGQTTWSLTAPCKVLFDTPFEIVLQARDAAFPDQIVGGSWSLVDSSTSEGTVVAASGALAWATSGVWEVRVPMRYTVLPAVDHNVEFRFRDLGRGSGAHDWAGGLAGGIVVDPLPDGAPEVEDTPPVAIPFAGGTFQLGEVVVLAGDVADADGGVLAYRWVEDARELAAGSVEVPAGGEPVPLPAHALVGLPLGAHALTLEVSDGTNAVAAAAWVTVIDTVAPTLAPVASTRVLWPPNGRRVPVTVAAHAHDGGGGPVTLTVEVTSEPTAHGGASDPGVEVVGIDDAAGEIALALRAELGPQGGERTYAVAVTATDGAGNASTAVVPITVSRPGAGPARR